MTPTNNIETLQSQVDQVKTDLDILKTETNEALKKSKAEAAADKVKNAKEEITKKLEALKGLSDENSKADVVKLEAMLKTLETSDSELETLKIVVIKPIELQKDNETIDNTADFTTITTGIESMKTMIAELQTIVDSYKLEKGKMSEGDKTAKEKAIEEKKIAIETKRKEIQTIIDKIRKARAEVKLDAIDDAKVQAALKTQKDMDEKNIADYQKQLDGLSNPANTFIEKIKNWASKTWERAKENPWKAAGAATGVGLLIRWISKLFKKKKNKETGGEKTEKKGFRDRWYGKALKRGLIGTWAARVLRGLFGGKRDIFGLGTDTNNPNTPVGPETIPGAPWAAEESKESLAEKNPEIKQAYNEIALNINDYYTKMYGEKNISWASGDDMFGESEFEKKWTESIPGTVVFMLDNRYATIGDMINEKAFARELIGADINKLLDGRRNRSAEEIKKFLAPIASKFDAKTRWLINAAKGVEDISNIIKGKPDAEKIITMVFRKSMKVISYMQNRKRALERELVKEKLQSDTKEWFNDKKPEDQEIAIDQYLKDPKNVESIHTDVVALFMSKRMIDFQDGKLVDCWYKTLKEKNLIEAKIAPEVEEDIKDLDKEKDELLDKEDDGSDKLSDLKEKIKNWKLEAEDQKNLEEFCEDFTEIMETSWKHTYLNKYFFLLEMFNTEADTWEKIYESSEYKTFVEAVKKGIQEILKKSKDWTLTEGDIDTLRADVDDYYIYQKELTNATYEVHESRNNDGDVYDIIIARSALVLRKGIMNFKEWIQLLVKGNTSGEHIKWWAIVAGNAAAVYLIRHPINGLKKVAQLGARTAEKWFNITEQLTGRAIRSNLPRGRGARWYNENSLNYAVSRWEISLENAMQVAKKKEWRVWLWPNARPIKTQEDLLEYLFTWRTDYAKLKELLTKYKDNKYVMRELVGMKYNGKRLSPKDRLKLDKAKMTFEINPDVLTKIQNIEVRIAWFKTQTEKDIFQSMMKNVRSIDQAQDLAIMSIDAKYLKYFESWTDQIISAEKFGKYLGKYGKKINPEQMSKLMEFFKEAKTANKLTAANKETIVLNALKNFSKIEAKGFSVGVIDELKLNVSQYEKISTKVKTGVGNMLKDLKILSKNPKMKPFNKAIESKITSLAEYEKTITPESIQATRDMGRLDKVTGFRNLSPEGIKALSWLNVLLKTEKWAEVLKALQGTKKLEEVKDILIKAGIDASKIDDGILLKIAQTKNASKIKNIINYGSEIQSISTLKKIFTNPAMKSFGKWLGFVGVAVDFAFVGMEANTQFSQAEVYKKYNVARGENMEAKAYFDVVTWGLAATAWLLATIGWVNAWNPVGRVSLGVAWVLTVGKEMGDMYYWEIDKFQQSYQDFLKKDLPAIKQDLIYVNNRQTWLDASFRDKMAILKYIPASPVNYIVGSIGESSIAEKAKSWKWTAEDAVHAIIYLEEIQKYPFAMGDLNSEEVLKNPELKALIEQQKQQHMKSVQERFAYTKKTYIDGKQNIISKERLEKAEWIAALDDILRESRIAQTIQADESYTNKTDVVWYKKYTGEMLKKSNSDAFGKLESFYAKNPTQFYETVAWLPYYESMCNEYKVGDVDYLQITQNLDFFKKYIAYKTLGMSVADLPVVNFDPQKIDYNEINSLLLTFGTTVTGFTSEESTNENIEYLDDVQVNKKYNVSLNLWQNVLYEIARSKYLNYAWPNDMANLKAFYSEEAKVTHGIYYDWEDRCINEDYGADNVFGTDIEINTIATIQHMRAHIDDALHSSATGKMIPANTELNKEYAKNFVEIIDKELVYRTNAEKYKQEILEYIKTNSKGKYIELNPDAIINWTKAWIKNIAAFVYLRDGKKFDAKTTKTWLTSQLIQ